MICAFIFDFLSKGNNEFGKKEGEKRKVDYLFIELERESKNRNYFLWSINRREGEKEISLCRKIFDVH